MKASNSVLIAIIVALVTFLTIGITFLVNVIINNSQVTPFLSYTWIILISISILSSIFVVFQTAQEKRANKPDNDKVTTVTKDMAGRFILREGPVTIEAPDAESAVMMFQAIFHGESSLKVESGLTIEVKEPEERDAPETKKDEE
jgi:general stress protein CsbA